MLLIHSNKVIKELVRRPQLPLGLAELHMNTDRGINRTLPHSDDGLPAYTEQMEPSDRMHLYTDGVTEGRAADCSRLGIDLLSDFVIRHSHSGTPHRRCSAAPPGPSPNISTAASPADATIVLIEWMPPPVRDHSLPPEVSGGSRANRDKPERSEKRASRWGPLRTAEILGAGA
jgi:hypothetical protein